MTSLQVDYWRLKETERTNKANESLRAQELGETIRHNQATEAIGWAQVGLAREQLKETTRHNQAVESVQQFQAETDRAHWDNWAKFQSDNIAIQRDSIEVQRERNDISSLEAQIHWKEYSLAKTKAEADIANKTRELDIREKELDLARDENTRKWFDTIFNFTGLVSKEARGWMSNSAG